MNTYEVVICHSAEGLPKWVSDSLRAELVKHWACPYIACTGVLLIRRNGEVLVFPEGDPEDNTFSRNFSFIAEELLQAYKTGYEAAWTDRGTLASEKQGGA